MSALLRSSLVQLVAVRKEQEKLHVRHGGDSYWCKYPLSTTIWIGSNYVWVSLDQVWLSSCPFWFGSLFFQKCTNLFLLPTHHIRTLGQDPSGSLFNALGILSVSFFNMQTTLHVSDHPVWMVYMGQAQDLYPGDQKWRLFSLVIYYKLYICIIGRLNLSQTMIYS